MAIKGKLAAFFAAAMLASPATAEPTLNADGCVASEIARQAHDVATQGGGVVELDETALKALVTKCEADTGTKVGSFHGMIRLKFTIPALTPG